MSTAGSYHRKLQEQAFRTRTRTRATRYKQVRSAGAADAMRRSKGPQLQELALLRLRDTKDLTRS